MWRKILAVVGGYLAMAAIIMAFSLALLAIAPGQFLNPDGTMKPADARWMPLNLVFATLAALAGGYVCAWIARTEVRKPVIALAVLMAALNLLLLFGENKSIPWWWTLSEGLLGIPAVLVGAWLRSRGNRSPAASSPAPTEA